MAQQRFEDRVPPGDGATPPAGETRATIGMGWLAQVKLRGAAANDNRLPPWSVAATSVVLLALAALLIYASVHALP